MGVVPLINHYQPKHMDLNTKFTSYTNQAQKNSKSLLYNEYNFMKRNNVRNLFWIPLLFIVF